MYTYIARTRGTLGTYALYTTYSAPLLASLGFRYTDLRRSVIITDLAVAKSHHSWSNADLCTLLEPLTKAVDHKWHTHNSLTYQVSYHAEVRTLFWSGTCI